MVVGTNTGLCSIDSRGKVTDLLRIGSTGYSLVNNAIFFSTTEGIFMLTGNVFSMSAGMDNIVKIDDTFSESCKSVFYDNQDKIIYAGTLNGVYSAAFKLQDVEDEL